MSEVARMISQLRLDSIRAVSDAADALLAACTARRTFRDVLTDTETAPLPSDFVQLIDKIEPHDRYNFDELTSSPVSITAVTPVVVAFRGRKRRGRYT